MKKYPYKFIILFFLLSILFGTFLLSLPGMTIRKISIIDKFFTATSAVCVTGLTVVDIGKSFTLLGQLVILLLIQIGGLGYMVLGSVLIALFGKIDIVQKNIIGESLNIKEFTKISQITGLLKKILILTFSFELIGGVLLLIKFLFIEKINMLNSVWYSVFHSISAFCNAGFTLFANSLENYKGDFVINIIITFLIFSGGLGFFVWIELINKLKNNKKGPLSFHTRTVLITTFSLIILGFVLIFILNMKTFSTIGFPLKTQLLISWFQSITPRTAGFNTFPIKDLSGLSILIIIILMFIGASPGSTGGGIKTTTFLVLVVSIYRYLSGEKDVSFLKRRIEINIVLKSFVIFFVCFCWIILVSSSIYLIDKFSFKEVFFEVVSAFGTVGLSLGITPYIDNLSKILLIITMLFGRVGGLTLLYLLFAKEPKEIKYLEEPIAIG